MLLDHRFCLKTLLACNHEPGVSLRVIASNGWQTRTLEPVSSEGPVPPDVRHEEKGRSGKSEAIRVFWELVVGQYKA
jgi:hypothetical protein